MDCGHGEVAVHRRHSRRRGTLLAGAGDELGTGLRGAHFAIRGRR